MRRLCAVLNTAFRRASVSALLLASVFLPATRSAGAGEKTKIAAVRWN